MKKSNAADERRSLARGEIDTFLATYEREPDHTRHVCKLALQLFDRLSERHGLDGSDRFLLEAAALMHDVGWSRAADGRAHHKHSCAMILAHPWRHLAPEQIHEIALIARYHRKAEPSRTHPPFDQLDAVRRRAVRWLAAQLRVSDALDRAHLQGIPSVQLAEGDGEFRLTLPQVPGWEAAEHGVEKKKGLLEKLLDAPLRCLPPPGARRRSDIE